MIERRRMSYGSGLELEPLKFTVIEDYSVFTFSMDANILAHDGTPGIDYIEYSLDKRTWNRVNYDVTNGTTIEIDDISRGTVYLRGSAKTFKSDDGGSTINTSSHCTLSGNIMSLLGTDTLSQDESYQFSFLFSSCLDLIDASNLLLPATTLTEGCYNDMFNSCQNLTTAPVLPATTLAEGCYSGMFSDCFSLTTSPELPATTLAANCYAGMFERCRSLTSSPTLPATTLASNCYQNMFSGCTGLTTAPELPATTLAEYCYSGMFQGCSGLTTAPELPATTLAEGCYFHMFKNCDSITTSPILSAATLVKNCYYEMFDGCTSLTSVTMLAVDKSATNCIKYWLHNVAQNGTIFKDESMTLLPGSDIPYGWTVQDYVLPPEAVDLGLPSGRKWANMNLGANSPEEDGLYFSWGNTEGHAKDSGYNFDQTTYNSTPGAAISADLSPSQDAAAVIMGGNWRMPTKTEFQELYDNTDLERVSDFEGTGVAGIKFMKKSNHSVFVFFPAAGSYDGTMLNNRGLCGSYWSSSFFTATNAYSLFFNSTDVYSQTRNNHRLGFTIRPVK